MIKFIGEYSQLEKYGFRQGKDYKDYKKCIEFEWEYNEYWLFPLDRDGNISINKETGHPWYAINIDDNNRVWVQIDSRVNGIRSEDMYSVLEVIVDMSKDNLIESVEM